MSNPEDATSPLDDRSRQPTWSLLTTVSPTNAPPTTPLPIPPSALLLRSYDPCRPPHLISGAAPTSPATPVVCGVFLELRVCIGAGRETTTKTIGPSASLPDLPQTRASFTTYRRPSFSSFPLLRIPPTHLGHARLPHRDAEEGGHVVPRPRGPHGRPHGGGELHGPVRRVGGAGVDL